jgi:hypothetical protein
MDLADTAHRLQMSGEIGPAAGDAHAIAMPRQCTHGVTADESRSTENGNKAFER